MEDMKKIDDKLQAKLDRATKKQQTHFEKFQRQTENARNKANKLYELADTYRAFADELDKRGDKLSSAKSRILDVYTESKEYPDLAERYEDQIIGKIINQSDYWDDNPKALAKIIREVADELSVLGTKLQKASELAASMSLHAEGDI